MRAVTPLVGQFDTLTMAQIAEAAGIGEADLRAVFADKEAVLRAFMDSVLAKVGAVMDPAEEVRQLEAIGVDQPLASRLLQVLDILDAYYRRVRGSLDAYYRGFNKGDESGEVGAPSFGRDGYRMLGQAPEVRQVVAKLLEPDARRLRLPAEVLAEAFLSLSRAVTRASGELGEPLPAEQAVDLFLHGAIR
ncbi:TetR/AcrR family transcriptional regulator [Actinoplanes aureus]|uniref:HTH tetR-type domain-containing protein n=1 Tax=Actinoplanes aureus TaxID=2792083 RepID=A0A931C1B0_9ACTN|nr:hypothetical protein [Actinoplanes aureus]MBG0561459.1 hypothetical protein [Actinoplanes aureus]